MLYIDTMEYYSALKMNKILIGVPCLFIDVLKSFIFYVINMLGVMSAILFFVFYHRYFLFPFYFSCLPVDCLSFS